jgi:hypothetical protein
MNSLQFSEPGPARATPANLCGHDVVFSHARIAADRRVTLRTLRRVPGACHTIYASAGLSHVPNDMA